MPETRAEPPEAAVDEPRSHRASNQVYEQLRSAVLTGRIRPNTPLLETDLAASLKVSRTPVRESLRRLPVDELSVPRKRGWAVRGHTKAEIRDRHETRVALESQAAHLTALRATDEEIQALVDAQAGRSHGLRGRSNCCLHDSILVAARTRS